MYVHSHPRSFFASFRSLLAPSSRKRERGREGNQKRRVDPSEQELTFSRFRVGGGCIQHQAGVSNFLLGRFEFAMRDFEEALLYLRGNEAMYVSLFSLFLPSRAINLTSFGLSLLFYTATTNNSV